MPLILVKPPPLQEFESRLEPSVFQTPLDKIASLARLLSGGAEEQLFGMAHVPSPPKELSAWVNQYAKGVMGKIPLLYREPDPDIIRQVRNVRQNPSYLIGTTEPLDPISESILLHPTFRQLFLRDRMGRFAAIKALAEAGYKRGSTDLAPGIQLIPEAGSASGFPILQIKEDFWGLR